MLYYRPSSVQRLKCMLNKPPKVRRWLVPPHRIKAYRDRPGWIETHHRVGGQQKSTRKPIKDAWNSYRAPSIKIPLRASFYHGCETFNFDKDLGSCYWGEAIDNRAYRPDDCILLFLTVCAQNTPSAWSPCTGPVPGDALHHSSAADVRIPCLVGPHRREE